MSEYDYQLPDGGLISITRPTGRKGFVHLLAEPSVNMSFNVIPDQDVPRVAVELLKALPEIRVPEKKLDNALRDLETRDKSPYELLINAITQLEALAQYHENTTARARDRKIDDIALRLWESLGPDRSEQIKDITWADLRAAAEATLTHLESTRETDT